jgi:predicted O-linked N-acetylglucosamine transferase (SPINDLY family)
LYAKLHLCLWDGLDAEIAQLASRIERGEAATPPFPVLLVSRSAALQRKAAENWLRVAIPAGAPPASIPKRAARHERIRVGYFSSDFRNHAVSVLTAELFEMHDRARFEVIAFSYGPDTQDAMRMRMERAFDRFLDVRAQSDAQIALLARGMEIDIAIDLVGYTAGFRPRIFALRAAPLQVSYLGYLGTMGAQFMDYLIADAAIVPPADAPHYAEKLIYLPSYQANDSKRLIADRRFTRLELGLPADGFVYCCFNASFKILPGTFDLWMRILERVEGSVLLLYSEGGPVQENLKREAARRGIRAERLVFGARLPAPEYLARYRAADLFLDTLPYNAGTTASDALWAGLPVLTCRGTSFAGALAASLLRAIELPELIASCEEEYEELAVALASDPARLADLKRRLAQNRLTTPLFDSRGFVRHVEAAYQRIYERYQADLPLEPIEINRI